MTAPERLVLDASGALAVLRAEPEAADVARLLGTTTAGGSIVVPDHFWLEVGNVLVRRYGWDIDAVIDAFLALDELGIETAPIDRPHVLLGLDLMATHGLSAYDAAYLALAETGDASLLTLDGGLAAAAGTRAIGRGLRGARETGEPYRPAEASARWSEHGRYLAALRKDAASA